MKIFATQHRFYVAMLSFFSFSQIFSEVLTLKDISIADLLIQNNSITYIKCDEALPFDYQQFPFMVHQYLQPYSGTFAETFILKIPNGRAQSNYGWVVIDGQYFIRELNWKSLSHHASFVDKISPENFQKVPGRVVVLGQAGYFQYWHWISEVLGRLALIEQEGIEYDWLYVPYYDTFMKQTFDLWGIDSSKIIEPSGEYYAIQADELIVPSLVSSLHYGFAPYACYPSYHVFSYVSQKLLQAALLRPVTCSLSQRIFISRQDAPGRHVLNEDEVFELFEKQGFVRYELSNMSIVDQIHLFAQADIVAGPAGTGITANSLYCKPGTKIIELFQALGDSTMWFVSQQKQLDYIGVQTIDFVWEYGNHGVDTMMLIEQIERVLGDLERSDLQSYYTLSR